MRLLISALLLFNSGVYQAAFQQPSPTVARKVVSYNDQIPGNEAEQWHLEDGLTALSAEPNSRLYIIAYGSRKDGPGKARRYAVRAKNYLVNYHVLDPQRIVTVDGGRREEFIVELWLVPKDAKPPEPESTITASDDLSDNLRYDDFTIGYDSFAAKTQDDAARLDGFASALKKEPKSWGCIVGYALGGEFERDPPGTALRIAREQRTYLIKKHHLPLSRLSVIDGGYGRRSVELWIMRPNAGLENGHRKPPKTENCQKLQ